MMLRAKGLDRLVKQEIRQARDAELKRLERGITSPVNLRINSNSGNGEVSAATLAQSFATKESLPEIRLIGPDRIELRIEPYAEGYVWRIRNGTLQKIERLNFEILAVQSFDAERGAFREAEGQFAGYWPMIPPLKSGDVTTGVIFLTFQEGRLRLGHTISANWLPWPTGDHAIDRRWRLLMRVRWDSHEWPMTMEARWRVGTNSVELLEVDGNTVAAAPPTRGECSESAAADVQTEGSMAKLPNPPESLRRLHILRWRELLRARGFNGDHLKWHQSAERRHAAARPKFSLAPPPLGQGNKVTHYFDGKEVPYDQWHKLQLEAWKRRENDPSIIDSIAISETTALAKARFEGIIEDYLALWAEGNHNSDDFGQWLDEIASGITHEVCAVWSGEWHAQWFDRACIKKVEETLGALKDEWRSKASKMEILHLENPHLSLGAIVAAKGDLKAAYSVNETNKVIESAQETLRRWQAATSGGELGDRTVPDRGESPAVTSRTDVPNPHSGMREEPLKEAREGGAAQRGVAIEVEKLKQKAEARVDKPIAEQRESAPTAAADDHLGEQQADEPIDQPEQGFDLATEAGRLAAVAKYRKQWSTDSWSCSEASLARTALIDPADLSKWKKGSLPSGSEKATRIEEALIKNKPPTRSVPGER